MKKLLPILLLLFASNVFSGNAGLGSLSKIHFLSNGVIIVYSNGTRTGAPDCAANHTSRFAIDGSTDGGKVQVSGILAMYASGKPVMIYGANHCNVHGDTETINYFRTND